MKIFTFINSYGKENYDFVATKWADALVMATNFETEFNKEGYIKLDTNINSVKITQIKLGFIDIRRKDCRKKKVIYICPECGYEGFPSIHYSSCTVCANTKRGFM